MRVQRFLVQNFPLRMVNILQPAGRTRADELGVPGMFRSRDDQSGYALPTGILLMRSLDAVRIVAEKRRSRKLPKRGPYPFQIGRYELLERVCSVRVTVPSPNPRRLAICRIESPWRRNFAT